MGGGENEKRKDIYRDCAALCICRYFDFLAAMGADASAVAAGSARAAGLRADRAGADGADGVLGEPALTGLRLQLGADFLLMAAALYYLGGAAALCAMLAASAAHELGHLAALELAGARVMRLRLGAGGGVLDYALDATAAAETLVLLAGPLAGALFGLLCLERGTDFYEFTGLAALLSTAFNLLPALPLDGGRLLELLLGSRLSAAATRVLMMVAGLISALMLIALGLRLRLLVLSAAGIYLGLLVIFPSLR